MEWWSAFSLKAPSNHLVMHARVHSFMHSFISSLFIEHGAKEGFVYFYFTLRWENMFATAEGEREGEGERESNGERKRERERVCFGHTWRYLRPCPTGAHTHGGISSALSSALASVQHLHQQCPRLSTPYV